MRKSLLFIAALCATVAVKAETITLEPGENKIEAVIPSLSDGDVIELQAGTYTEWHSLTFNTKVTILAAEGAKPKLALYNWKIQNDFEINGVEIKNVSQDNYLFRVYAEVAGTVAFKNCSMQLHDGVTSLQSYIRVEQAVGTLTIDNCVFKEFNATLANQVSHIKLGAAVGKLTINNCIFKDNAKTQETILEAQSRSINSFSMTNCTAYNCGGVNNDLAIFCEHATNVYVDHCTFYNCGKRVIYFTNNDVKESYLVQNCVVVNSEIPTTNNYCIAVYAGEVKNCAYYKVNAPRGENATVTGCTNADPLFVDPANGDFSFPINSPLAFAATDGSHIGDPRWGVNVSGAVDITTQLNIENQACGTAQASVNDATLIEFYPSKGDSKDTALWAGWVVNTEALAYKIAAEVTVASGWSLNMFLCDIATGALVNKYEYPSGSHSAISPVDLGTWDLSQVPAGQYLLKVKNNTAWGNIQLKSLSFTSAGGAVINVPATLPNDEAVLTGTKISRVDGAIKWGGEYDSTLNYVSWNINVEKAGYYDVLLSTGTTSGREYHIYLYDGDEQKDEVVETRTWSAKENENLGRLYIESAGLYVIRAYNLIHNSSASIVSLTLDYAGGAVIDVPATLPNDEAVLTGTKISRVDGAIKWGGEYDSTLNYVSWNINVEKAGYYDVLLSTGTTSGREYHIYLYDGDEQKDEVVETRTWSAKENENLGRLYIESAGLYVIRAYNLIHNSSASIVNLTLNYGGGAVIDIPATLPNEEAVLTGTKISRTAEGIAWGDNGNIAEDYAEWNISVAETGDYLVTMAVRTGEPSTHTFFINIYNGDAQVGDTIKETTKTPISLAAGTYTVHLGNNKQWSSAVMASVAIKSASGTVVEMPGTLQADDALLGGDDNVKVDGDGYICFSEGENVPNCWATWQTNWVKTGTYDVILDVNATKGHQLVVEVLDGENVIETFKYNYSTESGKLSIGKFVLSETKSYTIRLTNEQTWSDARIKSIAFIPFITIDNNDTEVDFTAYEGQIVTIKLNRTFKANMYNPICLPFALSSAALQNILKSEKSYVLGAATLEGQKLYVELEEGSGIYQGTPNMIKPSENVENPVFTNVEIKTISPDQTTRGVLRLQGSFASHTIDNPQNALLVGANNTLFFPNDETPYIPYIKSMRAYFILQDIQPSQMPKFACFREPGNAPTWMPIVGAETEKPNGKFIRDGRFVIVREGKEYNALGVER